MSDKDILRRIAERGLSLAQKEDTKFIDIFQHLLDEISRLPEYNSLYIKGVQVSEEELNKIRKTLRN